MLTYLLSILLVFGVTHGTFDPGPPLLLPPSIHFDKRVTNGSLSIPSLTNSTQSELQRAKDIVDQARKEWSAYKKAHLENPRRNVYTLRPEESVQGPVAMTDNGTIVETFPPPITDEISTAAAFLAEWNAAEGISNMTTQPLKKRAGTFWMENVDHLGTQPYGGNASYKVFRNVVTDYGADPTGKQDSTKMINNAIKDGNRCGADCYSSSTKNAIVYFPPGNYLVSTPIISLYGTQLIGDANSLPHIIASPDFIGLGVITTDVYVGGGQGIDGRDIEYYINTANFYRQIRNFVIDVTQANFDKDGTAGIHYQVSQATSLFNVKFLCSESANTTQMGIFAENGSGGFMSDLTFQGGKYGIYGGNQQFTAHRLSFTNVRTAIWVIWDWGWTWKNINIFNCQTGFNLTAEKGPASETGSVIIQDSIFKNTPNAIVTDPLNSKPGSNSTGITLDNVAFTTVTNAIVDSTGKTLLPGSVGSVDTFITGPEYADLTRDFTLGKQFNTPRLAGLAGNNLVGLPKPIFFEHPRPQYENLPASQFISVKKNGAKGDSVTDDTLVLQAIINNYATTSNIIYINAGSYLITDTITIPPGAKIVGELWAQLVASGPKFSDDSNPRPMIRVGNVGDKGSVEIQDLLFTTVGQTKGLILVEWNLEADKQGSAALWDCHARIGGAIGSQLTSTECPPVTSGINSGCMAGSMMFHITSEASAYLENMWLWVADHDLDDALLKDPNNTMPQLSVYVARGILIESRKPTWLYGTASEHSTYYQYGFYRAENIHAGMIQTETPYYQPNPTPPIPFSDLTAKFNGDPDFGACSTNASASGCDSAWAVRVERSANITISGAGLYSWFNIYDQSCVDPRTCQKSLVNLKDNGKNVLFLNLITIGSQNMVTTKNGQIDAASNELNSNHPKWSHISALEVSGDGIGPDDPVVYIDPTIWGQSSPTVKCSPPCILVLPPTVLPSETTISIPPYTTSLEIGWSSNGAFTGTTITTVLSIPPITTNTIDYSNVQVNSSTDLFNIIPTMSIMPSPFIITDSYPPGVTNSPATRTITPPPYPFSGSIIPSGVVYTSYILDGQTIYLLPNQTTTTTENGHTIIIGPSGIIIDGGPPFPPPTTTTTTSGITIGPPPPFFTVFPSSTVEFITTPVPKATTTVINGKTEPVIPCFAWFFFICTDGIQGIILFGFELPGIYPRGGPPPLPPRPPIPPGINWPPTIEWPSITIGPDGTPSYDDIDDDPDNECQTETSSICSNTISKAPTTTVTVTGACESVVGCSVTGSATTTTTSVCKLSAAALPSATGGLTKRAPDCGAKWAVVYPRNSDSQVETAKIQRAIAALDLPGTVYRSQSTMGTLGTMFWALERLTDDQMQTLANNNPEILIINRPVGSVGWDYQQAQDGGGGGGGRTQSNTRLKDDDGIDKNNPDLSANFNTPAINSVSKTLVKRAQKSDQPGLDEMVLISTPPKVDGRMATIGDMDGWYYRDDSQGNGQSIYALEWGFIPNNELPLRQISSIPVGPILPASVQDSPFKPGHGTCVAAKVIGNTVGVARNARVVVTSLNTQQAIHESWLDGLLQIYNTILSNQNRQGGTNSAIVNLSIQGKLRENEWSDALVSKMAIIIRELLRLGVPVITGAGNERSPQPLGYPGLFGVPGNQYHDAGGFDDLIVVGARLKNGIYGSPYTGSGPVGVDIYAPGINLRCPDGAGGMRDDATGTSFAAPQVAALAAYWKTLRGNLSPANVKRIITVEYARILDANNWPAGNVPIIWNGINTFCNQWPTTQSLAFEANATFYGNFSDRAVNDDPNCALPNNGGGTGPTLTFTSAATPSPTCGGKGCGTLCDPSSYFCSGQGTPPDFLDPLDPESPQNPSNPNHTTLPTTTTASPPPSTPTTTTTTTKPTGPSKPTPTLNGHPLRYTILQITSSDEPGTIDLDSVSTEADDLVQPSLCVQVDLIETLSKTGLPSDISNIKLQGATCEFKATGDWNTLHDLDQVGVLTCDKFSDAQCLKSDTLEHCDNAELPHGDDRQVWVFCIWG